MKKKALVLGIVASLGITSIGLPLLQTAQMVKAEEMVTEGMLAPLTLEVDTGVEETLSDGNLVVVKNITSEILEKIKSDCYISFKPQQGPFSSHHTSIVEEKGDKIILKIYSNSAGKVVIESNDGTYRKEFQLLTPAKDMDERTVCWDMKEKAIIGMDGCEYRTRNGGEKTEWKKVSGDKLSIDEGSPEAKMNYEIRVAGTANGFVGKEVIRFWGDSEFVFGRDGFEKGKKISGLEGMTEKIEIADDNDNAVVTVDYSKYMGNIEEVKYQVATWQTKSNEEVAWKALKTEGTTNTDIQIKKGQVVFLKKQTKEVSYIIYQDEMTDGIRRAIDVIKGGKSLYINLNSGVDFQYKEKSSSGSWKKVTRRLIETGYTDSEKIFLIRARNSFDFYGKPLEIRIAPDADDFKEHIRTLKGYQKTSGPLSLETHGLHIFEKEPVLEIPGWARREVQDYEYKLGDMSDDSNTGFMDFPPHKDYGNTMQIKFANTLKELENKKLRLRKKGEAKEIAIKFSKQELKAKQKEKEKVILVESDKDGGTFYYRKDGETEYKNISNGNGEIPVQEYGKYFIKKNWRFNKEMIDLGYGKGAFTGGSYRNGVTTSYIICPFPFGIFEEHYYLPTEEIVVNIKDPSAPDTEEEENQSGGSGGTGENQSGGNNQTTPGQGSGSTGSNQSDAGGSSAGGSSAGGSSTGGSSAGGSSTGGSSTGGSSVGSGISTTGGSTVSTDKKEEKTEKSKQTESANTGKMDTSELTKNETFSEKVETKVEEVKTKKTKLIVSDDKIKKVLSGENGKLKLNVKKASFVLEKEVLEAVFGNEEAKLEISVKANSGKKSTKDLKEAKRKAKKADLLQKKVFHILVKANGESLNDFDLNDGKIEVILSVRLKKAPKTIYVMNIKTGKLIKAKYDKKTGKVSFKTNEVGKFVLMKKNKK